MRGHHGRIRAVRSRITMVRHVHSSGMIPWPILGVDEIVDAQPQASGISKKEQRETDAKRDPHDELPGKGRVDEIIKPHVARDRDDGRGGIIDVDRAHKIALLTLQPEITREAFGVHREKTPEQWRYPAPWTS